MSRKKSGQKRREYSAELKEEAVQMLLDGHSAESVVSNLGLSGTSLVYRWKEISLALAEWSVQKACYLPEPEIVI